MKNFTLNKNFFKNKSLVFSAHLFASCDGHLEQLPMAELSIGADRKAWGEKSRPVYDQRKPTFQETKHKPFTPPSKDPKTKKLKKKKL